MQNQWALITGASSGIGFEYAKVLGERKYNLVIVSNEQQAIQEKGQWLKEEYKIEVFPVYLDLALPEAARQLYAYCQEKSLEVEVLINNAGMGIGGALELATEEEVSMQMNTNFFGVVNMCKAVLPYMRKARRGKIINISSIGGVMGIPYQGFYSASKFAVEGYSEALALEVHPFHIKVCLVQPGDFNTGFTDNRNISELTGQNEDYADSFLRSLKIIEKEERNGCDPRKLGAVICKIVARKNPPFRTKVGPLVQVLFAKSKSWLPDSMMQYALRIFYAIR